jgi:hypothetical protein
VIGSAKYDMCIVIGTVEKAVLHRKIDGSGGLRARQMYM